MERPDGELATLSFFPGVSAHTIESAQTIESLREKTEEIESRPGRFPLLVVSATAASSAETEEPSFEPKPFERINNVSLAALARKGMSLQEMRELLISRELEPDAVEVEIERLASVGLLDDEALAETLVRTLQQRKGLGRQGLSAELRRRKLDPVVIEEALAALDGGDELLRATEIAKKRAPQLRSLDKATAERRLSAFLMRKGYSGGIVSAAVRSALQPAASGGVRFQ